jgi:hypothetical protein
MSAPAPLASLVGCPGGSTSDARPGSIGSGVGHVRCAMARPAGSVMWR